MFKYQAASNTYQKILSRIVHDPKLAFLQVKNDSLVYFYKDEIGHPESILVTLSPTGEYRIYELLHQLNQNTQMRGKRAYFAKGAQGGMCFGRDLKTGEIVAVKKTWFNHGYLENAYATASYLQRQSKEAGISSPLIEMYAHGISSNKPKEKRNKKHQTSDLPAFYAIMKMGLRSMGDWNEPKTRHGNLRLSVEQKTQFIIDAIHFALLLEINNVHYPDFQSRNILLDSEYRFKVCDFDEFVGQEKKTVQFNYAYEASRWLYQEVDSSDIGKPIIDKLNSLGTEITNRKITEFSDVNEALVSLIRKTIEECESIVSESKTKCKDEILIDRTMIRRTYSAKDIVIADFFYYVGKRAVDPVIGLLYRMKDMNLTEAEKVKIKSSLENFQHSLNEHPTLLDFMTERNTTQITSTKAELK